MLWIKCLCFIYLFILFASIKSPNLPVTENNLPSLCTAFQTSGRPGGLTRGRTNARARTPIRANTTSCLVWSLRLLLEASIQAITRRQETRADICLSTEVQLASLIGVHRDGAGEGGRGGGCRFRVRVRIKDHRLVRASRRDKLIQKKPNKNQEQTQCLKNY